jgi:hypothetical protein
LCEQIKCHGIPGWAAGNARGYAEPRTWKS